MKTINSIIYYTIVAVAAMLCIGAAIFSDIYNGIAELFKGNNNER